MADVLIRHINSWDELDPVDRRLVERAFANQLNAYAPYSNFMVGAAILLSDGSIADGFNIENASYPLCLCAERSAIANALARGIDLEIEALAVIGGTHEMPAFPCGACRQVMYEMQTRQKKGYRVIVGSRTGSVYIAESPASLLPHAFGPEFLIQ